MLHRQLTARLDSIAFDLERSGYLRLALAVDQVSDKLGAFDPKDMKAWSHLQEMLMEAIEQTNKLHMTSDSSGRDSGKKIYDLLSQAQKECKKQFKSA